MPALQTGSAIAFLLALVSLGGPVSAQRAPTGVTGTVSALHPSSDLGSGSLTGAGGTLEMGLTSRLSLGLSGLWYLNAPLEMPVSDAGRAYDLFLPSVDLRASMLGNDTDLALLLGAGALRYNLEEYGGDPSRTTTIPTLSLGAAVRVHLTGPLYLQIEGRDWMSYVRESELGTQPSEGRGLSHSLDIRVSLSALFRRSEPTLASFEDLPLSYTQDFRPVDATAVEASPYVEAPLDHEHGRNADVVPIPPPPVATPVDSPQPPRPAVDHQPVEEMTKARPEPANVERKLGTIYFSVGSAEVGTSFRTLLRDVAAFMEQNPDATLALSGHTDPSGSLKLNLSLAERRGQAVEELLARVYEVEHERMDVTSFAIDYDAESPNLARRTDIFAIIPGTN